MKKQYVFMACAAIIFSLPFSYKKANAQSWNLNGNAGTTSSNFVGTSDSRGLRFRTNNVNRMIINASGNVGIGTVSPHAKLDVAGDIRQGGGQINLFETGSSTGFMHQIYHVHSAGSNPNNAIIFKVSNGAGVTNEIMRLNGAGNVGIGTSVPGFPLDLRSTSSTTQIRLSYPSTGTSYYSSIGFSDPNQGISNVCARLDLGFESLTGNSNSYLAFRTGQSPYAGNTDISLERMRITSTGNVGIGTTLPGHKLDVAGRMRVQTGNGSAGIWLMNNGNSFDAAFMGMYDDFHLGFYGSVLGNWGMTMNLTNGNVGIGVTPAAYKLDVCGTIRSKEIRVETGWCDYVFEDDYKLRPLQEVEAFIREKKHLPDVTKGEVIESDGLEVGKVSAQMIRKIEELTLYVIELQKQVDALKSE